MTADLLITDVRPWGGGEPTDVQITAGVISAITPAGVLAEMTAGNVVAGNGRIVVPAFSDVHVHLDSTRLGLPWRPNDAPGGGVWPNMLHDRDHWRSAEWSMPQRSEYMLGELIRHGTTRVRGYAQIDADCKLERFHAVLAARETHRDRADVAIMAFPQAGLLREEGVPELIEEALREGADVMGGIDPCALDGDPVRHLNIVFGSAEKFGVPIDFHLHEPGELGIFSLGKIIERTRALSMQGKVTISHALTLAHTPSPTVDAVLAQMAELDMAVTTCAPAGHNTLPLLKLTAAGIRVGLGDDGQRDYWSPYGDGDLLQRTWQLAFTNGFRRDELVEHALAVATQGGASVLDPGATRISGVGDRPGVQVGEPAELLLLDGEAVASVVMDRPAGRTVLHQGRVVAEGLQLI